MITDDFVYISKNMLNDFGFEEKGERFVSVFTKMELDKLSVIDILKLQSELRMLQQYVNDFASFVKGY